MRISESGKSIYLDMSVSYNEETSNIHLATQNAEGFRTTVNNKPDSVRCHPNLFAKLAKTLRDAGAPHPEIDEKAASEE